MSLTAIISGALASTQNLAFLLGAEQLMDAKNIKKMANNMSKTNEDSLSLSAEVVDLVRSFFFSFPVDRLSCMLTVRLL
jgi:hypothetical protein